MALESERQKLGLALVARYGKYLKDLPDKPDVPIFHAYQTEKLLNPKRTPEDILEELTRIGITVEFLDWVANQGYNIQLQHDLFYRKPGFGYVDAKKKIIGIGDGDNTPLVNLTKVHELLHIATPRTSTRETIANISYVIYEEVFDQIARPYSENEDFMALVGERIPHTRWNLYSL